MMLLNLSRDWLRVFLPHVLTRIHRISYGVLRPDDLARAMRLDPHMPRSRRLLCIPFVGKDTPSASSEFQSPDVVIGFTCLAYRFDGLRNTDFVELLKLMKEEMRDEAGVPIHRREAVKHYVSWVR
eukprot:gene4942-57190_t